MHLLRVADIEFFVELGPVCFLTISYHLEQKTTLCELVDQVLHLDGNQRNEVFDWRLHKSCLWKQDILEAQRRPA
jgi:hypothetical protein